MTKNQILRLSLILIIPLIIVGFFLAKSHTINPRKIVINCSLNLDYCSSELEEIDSNRLKYFNTLDTILYSPEAYSGPKAYLHNTESMIFKNRNVYDLSSYSSSIEIEEASRNNEQGNWNSLFFLFKRDYNQGNDVFYPADLCSISRHGQTDLFFNIGGRSMTCEGFFYFNILKDEQDLMRSIDTQILTLHKKSQKIVIAKSILIFLSPLITWVGLIYVYIFLRKGFYFVKDGKLQ